jgi:cysteine desulfurase/selenocysteine lyase
MRKVYFDNAATSTPKPQCVLDAMQDYLKTVGASPGRGGYARSLEAGRVVFDARQKIKNLFNAPSEENVVFTHNITYALNFVLSGLLKPHDHVITTGMEHNSVIRPLRFLQKTGEVELTVIPCDAQGNLNPDNIEKAIKPNTKLIVMTHASNVTGGIMPVEAVSDIKEGAGVFLMLDTAQTAGVLDIDFEKLKLDFLAFTGHKSLLGPPGTGGLVLTTESAQWVDPVIHGGTGSRSDMEFQPDMLPDKFEAGTLNTVGIAGLSAALDFLEERGISCIRKHESELTAAFIQGVNQIPRVKVYGPEEPEKRVATVSITIEGVDMGELAYSLDADYGIMIRSGLHCAPLAHKTIGTFPEGTLRFSFGLFNTMEEVSYCLEILGDLLKEYR